MEVRVVAVAEEVVAVVAVAGRHLHGVAQPLGGAILHRPYAGGAANSRGLWGDDFPGCAGEHAPALLPVPFPAGARPWGVVEHDF